VSVSAPPRRADSEHDRDLERRVADLEALIEEARRRARRRRRVYAAIALAVLGASAWALFGLGGNGGTAPGRSASGEPRGSLTASGQGRWQSTGGPEGGGVLAVAVDPANSEIVYAGGWGTVFKSTDGGGRWRSVTHKPWTQVTALAIDPTRPDTVYAASDRGVAKSLDGGRSWRMVDTGLLAGDTFQRWGRGRWLGLLLDPNRPQTLYTLGWSGLFTTTTGGRRWHFTRPPLGRYWFLTAAAIDPAHPGTLYASWARYGVGSNLYKSTDAGDSWQRIPIRGLRPSFASLTIPADSPGTLLATVDTDPGIYASTDGGGTWTLVTPPLQTGDGVRVIAGSQGTLYATTSSGTLFSSTDAGTTWQTVTTTSALDDGLLAVDPQDPATLYGGGDGVVKSVDGGHTWTSMHNVLVNTLITSLVLAPGSSTTLYAGTYGGVFTTTNGGQTWQLAKSAAIGPWADILALAVSPQRPQVAYAVAQGRGLLTSSDAGAHWRRMQTPFPSKGVQAFAIDPRQPQTMYVADCGGACSQGTLQKTIDGGTTWQTIAGIPWAVQSLAIDPHHPSTLFAGTNRGDIYRSNDGGRSWQRVVRPPTLPHSHLYAIVAIAIDPRDPDNIYAGRRHDGVIKTSDGGNSLTRANTGLNDTHINALTIDPHDPQVLLASTQAGVFKTSNAGETWQPYGQTPGGVTAFAIDPTGRTAYAATNGHGVESRPLSP